MLVIITFFTLFVFIYIYQRFIRNRKIIPPGLKKLPIEKGWPILGIIPQIEYPLVFYLMKLGEKYGPCFLIRFGTREIVILNNYKVIKDLLLNDGINFSGRWKMVGKVIDYHESGIVLTDGNVWSKQRSFALKVLKDFGVGKSRSLEIVQNECAHFLKELKELHGTPIDFSKLIPLYTLNIISKFVMNKRFDYADPDFFNFSDVMNAFLKKTDLIQFIHLMFPFLENFDWIRKFMLMISNRFSKLHKAQRYIRSEIEEHSKKLNLTSEGEDYIDRFLIEQHRLKERTGSIDTFTEWNLIQSFFELYLAGFETTSTTLGWTMMLMARHSEIQNKVYNEIIEVIGSERCPTMNDKKSLEYTQAVMDEIFRFSSVAPLGLIHRSLNDTSFDGFFIPGNSIVFLNLLFCHRDPETWKKPNEFYPEHFLSFKDDGTLKYAPREELIPFGIGKRQCLGESLARMEFFIFYVRILQRYEVRFAEKISDEMYEEAMRANDGFIRFSKIQNFIFTRRR